MFYLFSLLARAAIVPASEVDFQVRVSGTIAEIEVRQTFRNDSTERVDAVYRFPLHARAVVDGMQIRLEDRTIDGVIQEKEEARRAYEEAVEAGQTAALTETEQWNLYVQRVGNIPPGAELEVILRLVQPVDRVGRGYELSLPVGNTGGFEHDPLLSPAADVVMEIDAGLPLKNVECVSHEAFESPTGDGWSVLLSDVSPDAGPVVVRWSLADDGAQIGAVYDEEHVMILFEPPAVASPQDLRPVDVTLISEPRFAGAAAQLGRQLGWPVAFVGDVAEEIRRRLEQKIEGRQPVLVVVGDGRWADEALLHEVERLESSLHIFTVGGSSSANRYYLDDLAARSGGRSFYLPYDAKSVESAVAQPTLAGIRIDWADWGEADLASGIPDVLLGQPVQVLARTSYTHGGVIELSGWVGEERREFRIVPRPVAQGRGLGSTWARARIEALGRRQIRTAVSARDEGLPLALEYAILSPWTAFVAIDPRVHRAQVLSLDGQPKPASGEPSSDRSAMVDEVEFTDLLAGASMSLDSETTIIVRSNSSFSSAAGNTQVSGRADPFAWIPAPTGAHGGDLSLGSREFFGTVGYDRTRVQDGRWEQLPMSLQAEFRGQIARLGYTHQRLSAPVLTELDVRRDAVDVVVDIDVEAGWLAVDGLVQSLSCFRCDPTRTMALDLRGERTWTMRHLRVGVGTAASVGQLRAGQQSDRASLVVGPSASVSWNPRRATGYIQAIPQLGFQTQSGFLPSLAGEIGPSFRQVSLLLGGAQRFDTSRPMWGLPRVRTAWLGLGVGRQRPWGRLKLGWEEAQGPLLSRIELLRELGEGTWQRRALVAEVDADLRRGILRLDWAARYTRVLSTDANLGQPTAPYVPGLLRAHRPFWTQGTAQLRLGSRTLRLDGGVASPLPVSGWWGRWQAHAALGASQEIRRGRNTVVALSLTGEVWSGRPGDPDPRRLDGWISPDRAGLWAARAGLSIRR